jgi:wee1-like protein kinase
MEDDRLYIQTELCTGTLADENERSRLPEQRRYKLLREMLLALDFIHRNGMVHLDIKPQNILVKNDQYKLGDFGLVTKSSALNDAEEGDSRYMSMEVLSGDSTDLTKSDIFSLGATLYELCLGRPLPMNGDEWQELRAGRLAPLVGASPDLASIVHQMMNPIAELRPTADELLKHPQLLSEEQKALVMERSKVANAKLQLAAQAQQLAYGGGLLAAPRKGLVRANTWNGSSMLPSC